MAPETVAGSGASGRFFRRREMTRPSSTSWCKFVPRGRMMGPELGASSELAGLRKKNGCVGRAEESSEMWSLVEGIEQM